MTVQARRICVVGDELVAGVGDPKALGWLGRVTARTPRTPLEPPPAVLALPVPGETTAGLAARWEAEVMLRLGPDPAPEPAPVGPKGEPDAPRPWPLPP